MNDYRSSHEGVNRGRIYDDRYAEAYTRELWSQVERPVLESVFAEIAAAGAGSCLDFACGTGRISEILTGVFPRVVGVDVSADMLEVAREKCPKAQFVLADLTRGDPLEDRFDVVSAFRFFANAEPPLRRGAMAALMAHLKPGGYLVVNNHQNRESAVGRMRQLWPGSRRPFLPLRALPDLIAESGLRLETVLGIDFLPQWRSLGVLPPALQGRIERRLIARGRRAAWALNVVYVARAPGSATMEGTRPQRERGTWFA